MELVVQNYLLIGAGTIISLLLAALIFVGSFAGKKISGEIRAARETGTKAVDELSKIGSRMDTAEVRHGHLTQNIDTLIKKMDKVDLLGEEHAVIKYRLTQEEEGLKLLNTKHLELERHVYSAPSVRG